MKKINNFVAYTIAGLIIAGMVGACILLLGYLVRGIIAVWTF